MNRVCLFVAVQLLGLVLALALIVYVAQPTLYEDGSGTIFDTVYCLPLALCQ